MTVMVSFTDNGTNVGTTSGSWPANRSVSRPTLARITSTWPLDSAPVVHASVVTGNERVRRAVATSRLACPPVIRARSRSHAGIDVAASTSHNSAASNAPTAAATMASKRSRMASNSMSEAESAGTVRVSTSRPNRSNNAVLVHVFD